MNDPQTSAAQALLGAARRAWREGRDEQAEDLEQLATRMANEPVQLPIPLGLLTMLDEALAAPSAEGRLSPDGSTAVATDKAVRARRAAQALALRARAI